MAPPSSHRLPTISASQALQSLQSSGPRAIPTGLAQLDSLLGGHGAKGRPIGRAGSAGFARRQLTEIYGPPGIGKTTFGLQACRTALDAGGRVVWVEAAAPLSRARADEMLFAPKPSHGHSHSSSAPEAGTVVDPSTRFHRYTVPTLAHLLALFAHPNSSFPPQATSLVVIDSISTLLDNAYPRNNKNPNTDAGRWASGRRYAVVNELASKLAKLAAVHDVAVVVTSQTVTRLRPGAGAVLMPAISNTEWDNSIATRLVLFRDWPPKLGPTAKYEDEKRRKIRFAGLVKVGGIGITQRSGLGTVVPFAIEKFGLSGIDFESDSIPMQNLTSPVRPTKRSFVEIADSDDEADSEYDWDEEVGVAAEGLIDDAALAANTARENVGPPTKRAFTIT